MPVIVRNNEANSFLCINQSDVDGEDSTWPALLTDLESVARDSDLLLDDEGLGRAVVFFELKGTDALPKATFSAAAYGMEPRKYWEYLTQVLFGRRPLEDPARRFCEIMRVLVLIP